MKKIIKLFKRLCKEEGVFNNKKVMSPIIKFMLEQKTCVFYGMDSHRTRYTSKEQMSFYKIQLQLASILIDKKELNKNDHYTLQENTLRRYVKKYQRVPIRDLDNGIEDVWQAVIDYSEKDKMEKKIKEYHPA